ncbi:MAG: CAP domain-containing protein [Hyphomicrobiales bacterium]
MIKIIKMMSRPVALTTFFGLTLFLSACAEKPAPVVENAPPAFYRNLETAGSILDLKDAARTISTYRVSKGLKPVVIDTNLVALAQSHANAQAKAKKIGHSIGGSFRSRIRRLENKRGHSVENLSAGYRTFAAAFSGWTNSKGHNANLLNKKVTRMGIAKAVNSKSKYKVFWTLIMTSEPL